jgi:undecaprenyl-phosphate 4-deoxy-4-formamido-L-arabinose transferase
MYRRNIIDHIRLFKEKSYYLNVLTGWVGNKITEVEINTENRRYEVSKYNIFGLIKLFFDIITGFSTIPLRAISFIGIIMSLLGFLSGITLIVVRYATRNYISDLSVLIAILLILFGAQLFGLGLVGEYIGRIYTETKDRPDYIIEEIIQEKEK